MSTCKRGLRSSLPGLLVAVTAVWAGAGDMPLAAQQSTQAQNTQSLSQQPTQGWIPIDAGSAGAATPASPAMPVMPSVSAPSIGGGFYVPGSKDFYMPQTAARANQAVGSTGATVGSGTQSSAGAAGTTAATAGATNAASGAQTAAGSTATAGSAGLQQAQASTLQNLSLAASTQSANQLSSILSAGDLNSLQSGGYIGSFSSLLGSNANLSSLQGLTAAGTAGADTVMLQKILSELNEIKQEVAAQKTAGAVGTVASAAGSAGNASSAASNAANTVASAAYGTQPRILRFLINGYDVLPSCRQLYFSTQESDGSFLLTGDRKYNADGKIRTETFYLLFRATGSKSGATSYHVVPSLSQDYANENSFFYRLAARSDLTATRTGNMITMRASDDSWSSDLLITMDN